MTKRIISAVMAAALLLGLIGAIPAQAAYKLPYVIDVDITNQITTIYRASDGTIVRQMICSTGKNNSTPLGVWYMVHKERGSERGPWTWLNDYHCYVKYMTRVHLGYMFHSLPYLKKEEGALDPAAAEKLGEPDSHGCVRLRVEDAYFIAKNCLDGTRVNFFESGERNEDLRQLLLVSSYTDEEGMSYQEFLGYSENELCRGCGGAEVQDLQNRLRDLGYFDGTINGQFGTDTTAAVKQVQKALGMAQNGIATEVFLTAVYADDAPVSEGQVPLAEGRSGPIVKKLQQALNKLGLYEGAEDGVYDKEVSDAVKAFQGVCGYPAKGSLTPEMQQAIYYMLDQITEKLGDDFTAVREDEEITMATVKSTVNIIVREKADTKSDSVGKLRNGDTVMVSAVKGSWANIISGSNSGFIYKKYLQPYKQNNVILRVSGANGESLSFGHSLQDYTGGTKTFAEEFHSLYISGRFASSITSKTRFATVNTGSDSVELNMRAEPDGASEVLLTVPNGTELEVIEEVEGFTRVRYGGAAGYLMNDYITVREGEADTGDAEEEQATASKAKVVKKATVYAEGSDDSKKLGALKAGTEVTVLEMSTSDEWVRISLKGKEGYMKDADLQFVQE